MNSEFKNFANNWQSDVHTWNAKYYQDKQGSIRTLERPRHRSDNAFQRFATIHKKHSKATFRNNRVDAYTLQLFCRIVHAYSRSQQNDDSRQMGLLADSEDLLETILEEHVRPFLSSRNIHGFLASDICENSHSALLEVDSSIRPVHTYQDFMEESSMETHFEETRMKHVASVSSFTQLSCQTELFMASPPDLDHGYEKSELKKEIISINEDFGCDEEIMSKEEEASIKEEIRVKYSDTKTLRELRKEILVRSEKAKLPLSAKKVMQEWCIQNLHNPYPSKEKKFEIAEKCDLDFTQVDDWFTNYRKRFWKKKMKFDA